MKKIRMVLGLLAVGLGVLIVSGCRAKPGVDSTFRTQPLEGHKIISPRYRMTDPQPGEWEDVRNKIKPGAGSIDPIEDKRWSSVVVYFAYDSAAVGPAERPKLEALSKHLGAHPTYCVVIEGHCDERGSDEYNRALGESRALAVRDYIAGLGIDASRLETVSYGEERPVVTGAATESEHQKNRRAEFIIGIRRK